MKLTRNERPLRTRRLPHHDRKTGFYHSPHVVILGAGASRACCLTGDRNGRKLPLMNDLVECVGIEDIICKSGYDPNTNFEAIYSQIYRDGNTSALRELDDVIRQYFAEIVLPEEPTIYDYLMLSLRPKDIIVSFNWDPLLPQAYKRWRHLGAVLPEMRFLHGNIDIGVDRTKKVFGFLSDEPYECRTLMPTKLLYPVEQKDYNTDTFIAECWKMTTDYLAEAYYVTIFGYSAPLTDVEARNLLLRAWQENPTRELAQLNIVDIREPSEVERSWANFIEGIHGGASQIFSDDFLLRHPRRTCEAFGSATLQQDPWHEDRFPLLGAISLTELEAWIKPFIEEEISGRLAGKPLH